MRSMLAPRLKSGTESSVCTQFSRGLTSPAQIFRIGLTSWRQFLRHKCFFGQNPLVSLISRNLQQGS